MRHVLDAMNDGGPLQDFQDVHDALQTKEMLLDSTTGVREAVVPCLAPSTPRRHFEMVHDDDIAAL